MMNRWMPGVVVGLGAAAILAERAENTFVRGGHRQCRRPRTLIPIVTLWTGASGNFFIPE